MFPEVSATDPVLLDQEIMDDLPVAHPVDIALAVIMMIAVVVIVVCRAKSPCSRVVHSSNIVSRIVRQYQAYKFCQAAILTQVDRTPPRGYDDYDRDRRYTRSPPRGGRAPPIDDYPPPRRGGGFEDPYRGRDYPPADPYVNGRPPYDRPPPRDYPPRESGYADYDRRGRYW